MFDFLGFLKPVTEYLIDHFGLVGMILAINMPLILLLLAAAVVVGLYKLIKGGGAMSLQQRLKKANALRAQGKYAEAYDLYVQIRQKQKEKKLVTAYDMGMLCKEGVVSGWRLRDEESKPEYWFEKSLNPFNADSYYQYGLCLRETDSGSRLRAATGAKHIFQAARLGCKEAEQLAEKLKHEAAMALAKMDVRAAAGFGSTDAQYMMYHEARGDEKLQWLELAADQKHPEASCQLGLMYARGEGVTKNFYKAVPYLEVAGEHGDMNAQAYLGLICNSKEYRRANTEEAIKWYKLAAEQGHAYSMYNLAVIYARKMDEHAKRNNLGTRFDCLMDHTYMAYFQKFQHWKAKAEEHGLVPDKVR